MTQYTIYETNGGSLHLYAYDNGQLNFAVDDWEIKPIMDAYLDLLEGYTAEQLNARADWPLDDDDLENEEAAAASYEQNPAAAKLIADNNGLYFEHAGRAGEQFLHAAQWYTEQERVFNACTTYEETERVCKDIYNTLQLSSYNVMQLFEAATRTACDIACGFDDYDPNEFEYLADCIQACGRALNLLLNCQCDHFRSHGNEIQHVSDADDAEERQLSFEFRSSDVKKNEQVESIISTYWPHDRHTEHSATIYDRDGENVLKTWKYTR